MIHNNPPPGYLTIAGACSLLGMSRQNFYQTGLNELVEGWKVGAALGAILYSEGQIKDLNRWLQIRQGLVALGVWSATQPVANPKWQAVVSEGDYDASCPKCGLLGVTTALSKAVWCLRCGVNDN